MRHIFPRRRNPPLIGPVNSDPPTQRGISPRALAGVQYLDSDRSIEGRIALEKGDPLVFEIDIGPEESTFMPGFNKDIGRNWTLSGFLGANGTKTSATMNFGYRW